MKKILLKCYIRFLENLGEKVITISIAGDKISKYNNLFPN